MVLRSLCIFLLMSFIAVASEYYAKIEPLETITIKAQVNGEVLRTLKSKEGELVTGVLVGLDDKLNREDLNTTLESLLLTKKMVDLNRKMVAGFKKSMSQKRALFEKTSRLSTVSVSQKDALYSSYIAAKSQYNAILEKILTLKNQKITLQQRVNLLQDTIEKKTIHIRSKYLYKLMVKKGEFVTVATPLAIVKDISKGKLTLYLSKDDLQDIEKKSIYINGKKSALKFHKIWRVADSQYISSYRAEIIVNAPLQFSKLVKVELK